MQMKYHYLMCVRVLSQSEDAEKSLTSDTHTDTEVFFQPLLAFSHTQPTENSKLVVVIN